MERRPHAFSTWLSTTWRIRISFSWRVHDAAGAGLRSSFSDAGRLLEGAEPEVALLAATRPEVEPLLRVVEAPREETVAGKPWWLCRFSKGAGSGTGVIIQAGYDKTNTAHALTCLLESTRPSLVLQVGIGGAFREAGLDLGDIVLATAEIYGDTGIRAPEGWISTEEFGFPLLERNGRRFWNRFPLDDGLVQRCAEVVSAGDWGVRAPRVVAGSCVTLSEISGRTEDGDDLHRRWDAPIPRRNHLRATLHQPVVQGETIPETTTVPLQEREPELLRRDPPFRCPDARIPVNLRCSQHNIAQIQARFPEGPAYAYLQDQARSCALQQTGQSVGGVGLVIAGLNDDPCPAPRSFGEPAEPPGFPGNRLLPGSFHHAEKGLDLRPGSSKEGNLRLRPLKQAPVIRKRGPQSRSRSIMHPPREGYPGPPGS